MVGGRRLHAAKVGRLPVAIVFCRKISLNPDSPAFVPSASLAQHHPFSSSTASSASSYPCGRCVGGFTGRVSKFRVDSHELNRSRACSASHRNSRRNALGMEARLWMTPNIKAQLSLYNHWHLYEPQSTGSLWCADRMCSPPTLPCRSSGMCRTAGISRLSFL